MVRLKNQRFLSYFFIAGFFTLVGIFIATGLDLPSRSFSQEKRSATYLNAGVVSPFVAVVDRVRDGVVNISAEKVEDLSRYHSWFPFGDRRRVPSFSLGSGFVFDPEGYVLTNNHVIAEATEIWVTLSDQSRLKARLVGSDKETDVAVLKIEPDQKLRALDLGNSDSLRVGDWALAVGNPFPQENLDRTVTVGVVSAKGRSNLQFGRDETPAYQDYIQTDAAINQGNSGGPLVDIHGQVVGINSAIASPSGGNVGIGFAIPINLVKEILPELMRSGKVTRGWLGVSLQDLNKDLAASYGLKTNEGVILSEVFESGPAGAAGLRQGDVIIKFDGKKVTDVTQFRFWVASAGPGKAVTVEVLRNGKPMSFTVRLAERNASLASISGRQRPSAPADARLGMTIRTATRELAQRFDVEYHPGVIVLDVEPGSPADRKGIEPGFIISEVNGRPVASENDFQEALKGARKDRPLSLLIRDLDSQPSYVALRAGE
ncbi:MAG TPA: Do family serine endopeptidase [Verrucomicrobiae bacterium]|nr:Do family serine endopeptidase [Verrucomicrobiae bacterium]